MESINDKGYNLVISVGSIACSNNEPYKDTSIYRYLEARKQYAIHYINEKDEAHKQVILSLIGQINDCLRKFLLIV